MSDVVLNCDDEHCSASVHSLSADLRFMAVHGLRTTHHQLKLPLCLSPHTWLQGKPSTTRPLLLYLLYKPCSSAYCT